MLRRLAPLAAALLVALLAVPAALAGGSRAAGGAPLVFDGGSAAQRAQVRSALRASAFPWAVLPQAVVVHIAHGAPDQALPGQIWIDADLLDAGTTSWGVVQHELAHEVDLLLLDPASRAALARLLGGSAWWSGGVAHGDDPAERFASTLAWAYWPSPENVLEPASPRDEAGHVAPALFRATLARLLPSVAKARVRVSLHR
ncbi:MAG TPA: hypothetical protein VFJ77_01025 [Gaiellaceae bacterium]|nr:hypothetical protein [Gaiellaceae bacterium]